MDLRDDNGPTTAEWPLGLLRMALLELGRRMVAAGVVDDPTLALELEPAEIDRGTVRNEPPPPRCEPAPIGERR